MAHNAHVFAYRIYQARQKYGRPFANEEGNTHKPSDTFYLDAWRASRMAKKAA